MGDLLVFICGVAVLFISGGLAYAAIRAAVRGLTAFSARHYWYYFPLAVLFTVIAFRSTMFCLDLLNIYVVSNVIVFD